jgi:tetratricopeptide (TPR) repeat protein
VAQQQGEHGAAQPLFEESLAIYRKLGFKPGVAWSLNDLGIAARRRAEYAAARALFEESLAIARAMGHQWGIACSLAGLGGVARLQQEYGTARALFEESLAIFRELGHKQGVVEDLEGLAAVAVTQAQPERAARLFGAAEGLREAAGAPLPHAERAEHNRSVAAVRTVLGEEAFAAAWAEGRAMTLNQAVAYALAAPEDTKRGYLRTHWGSTSRTGNN